MAIPPKLERELEELGTEKALATITDDAMVNLVIRRFQLGPGYNVTETDLLLRIPLSYPDAGPDMFWVEPNVLLANGQTPQAAECMEMYLGRQWRRFSWHRATWNSNTDNLSSYLEFIRARLRQRK